MTHVDPRDVQALGLALLHFVWQGAVLGILLAALGRLLRHAAPQVRYLLAAATLLIMLTAPLATFALLRPLGEPGASNVEPSPGAGAETARLALGGGASLPSPDLRHRVEPLLPALVGLWGAGVLLLSLRTLGGWALVQRLKRSGLAAPPPELAATLARLLDRLRVSAPVKLSQSALVQVPTVIGWLRPVILVPASALSGLTPQQIELILAHELAHVRRRDYLVNLLQTAVETLLFYHPAVFWVSRRMRIEREHCCDDLAVAACGNPVRYARALADLQGMCADAPALAMAATGGSLFERVARLVGPPAHSSRASRGLAALLVVGSLALAQGALSSLVGVAPPSVSAAALVQPLETAAEPELPQTAAPFAAPEARPQPQKAPRANAEPRAFPIERILELARAGVTPEYIDEMDALGYKTLSAEQLMALRNQGVGADYIKALAEAGYRDLTPDQLLSLRSQGVSAEYARDMKNLGLEGLTLSDLLALRAQGVSSEFLTEMKEAGYNDLSVSKLVALRAQGVNGRFAAELKALGYEGLSVNKLIALRSQGVDPEYVRALKGLGYKEIALPMLLALRSQGVTPEWVRGLQETGYKDLPVGALVEMRAAGVTPEFVREMKEAGFDKLTPEELIELRHGGVRGDLVKRLRGRQ